MRIIAGAARGIKLDTPNGLGTRPTLDRVREAVFGSLQFDIKESRCLDLFSGSGAMGIEALSRGAASCVFVDSSKECIRIIRANLAKTRFAGEVRQMSYDNALMELCGSFDFIFMDPPYASGYYGRAASIIKERSLLSENGRIIAEHDGTLCGFDSYTALKTRRYGKVYVTWLCNEGEIQI